MIRGLVRAARYARSWKAGANVVVQHTEIQRGGASVDATLVLPQRRCGPLPGWIAVGGVSRMGRFHPQLVRFTEALASSGAAVLVPEVPEWRDLRVTPRVTAPTIQGCIEHLREEPSVRPGKYGLIGFSFGAPQVAIAATREDLVDDVAGIVLFGGYCCLDRVLRYQLTGHHEWEGVDYTLDPDPYGRWVVAGNHLTDVPGYEDAGDVAAALHRLASAASDERIKAWEPQHDCLIKELRLALPARHQTLFDHLATPTDGQRPDRDASLELATQLAEACRRVEPLLEPAEALAGVNVPTRLIHGRSDRLIPFTESLRLMAGLPEESREDLTVTGLFDHSADYSPHALVDRLRETVKLFEACRGLINTH